MVDDRTVWNLERKKDIGVDLFFVSSRNFKRIQGFYTKFQAISRDQGAKINSRLLKGFKEPWEPCMLNIVCFIGEVEDMEWPPKHFTNIHIWHLWS